VGAVSNPLSDNAIAMMALLISLLSDALISVDVVTTETAFECQSYVSTVRDVLYLNIALTVELNTGAMVRGGHKNNRPSSQSQGPLA
jgi:hypothetical protein